MCINIELKKGSKLKKIFHKLYDKFEGFIFSIVEKLPEKLIPSKMMNLLERHLNKRIQHLEQQNIEDTWRLAYLDKTIEEKGIKR